jgi:hypothetical protein
MPISWEAWGCTVHNLREGEKLSFYTFPDRSRSPVRRDKWLNAVKRQLPDGRHWGPSKHLVLCSKHFVTGKPSKDPCHPDYVPSVFAHESQSDEKASAAIARFKRRGREPTLTAKRAKVLTETSGEQSPAGIIASNIDGSEPNVLPKSDTATTDCHFMHLQQQITTLTTEVDFLRQERNEAQEKVQSLQKELNRTRLSVSCVQGNEKCCRFYTGISFVVFMHVFNFLMKFSTNQHSKDSLSFEDQFFLTLVRLRLNLPFKFIAQQCNSSDEKIRRYFWKWIDLMHDKLSFLVTWPSRKAIMDTLPSVIRI